jgi:hypothetical protein
LKNPHHFPARGFALKADSKDNAIMCYSDLRRTFNDIWISDNYSANTDSDTLCGGRYMNDTRLEGMRVFTWSVNFKVMKIEVFEITIERTVSLNYCCLSLPILFLALTPNS